MAQAAKGRLNYRCPSCFIRDIDIDMFYEEEKKEYYCLRCGFTGVEETVLQLNEQIRFRYRCMKLRVADFGEDNEPVSFVPHQGGTQ